MGLNELRKLRDLLIQYRKAILTQKQNDIIKNLNSHLDTMCVLYSAVQDNKRKVSSILNDVNDLIEEMEEENYDN